MLSGEFSTIPLSEVLVHRDARTRRKLYEGSISDLADSIKRLGLIHPIVLDRNHVLVAGETRLMACKRLGWASIPFQYSDTLEENELLGIELEENVKRTDLDWKDKCDALMRYHNLQKATHTKWVLSDTAKAVGYSIKSIHDMLHVAEALESGDEKVLGTSRYSTAVNLLARAKERSETDAISAIKETAQVPETAEILVADFHEWAPSYAGRPFNLLHIDFPYGLDFQDSGFTSGVVTGHYEDSEDVYWALLSTLLDNIDSLTGESCHLIFWFSMKFYQKTLEQLRTQWEVNPVPLVWHKSDNKGIIPRPSFDPRHVYETAFFASRGERKIIQPVADLFSGPTEKIADHASEKSETMLKHFFRMVVDSNTRLLDPTAGSASALRAAKAMRAASVLGLEQNEVFAADARRAMGGTK